MHIKSLAASECSINTSYYGYVITEQPDLDFSIWVLLHFTIVSLMIQNVCGKHASICHHTTFPTFHCVVLPRAFPVFGIQQFIAKKPEDTASLLPPPLVCSDMALKHRQAMRARAVSFQRRREL